MLIYKFMRILRTNINLALSVALIISALFISYALIAQATSEEDIVYPIAELGNCKNKAECKTYCDQPKNLDACLDFAEEHNLIPEDELEQARNFADMGGVGPGGCTSKDSCETYCEDIDNMDECLDFAVENNLMPPEELEEALKVQAALAGGATLPGGCRTKDECEDYCEGGDSSRMKECIAFAEAAGFIPEDELEEAKMVLAAIERGAQPPPCRGREACDAYCAEPNNFEQCITFAEAAGFMSPEELAMARKTGGKGPGGCRGRECEDFCEKEENMPVCIEFAIENGMMSAEDAEMARKTGGKGPGNCKGKEECENFCQDPVNQEVCFNFAKEHGLISEEDLRQMGEGKQMMLEAFDNAPPEVQDCLSSALGPDFIEQLRAGTAMPSRELGDKMQKCFGQTMGGPGGPGGFPGGPGGFPGGGPSGMGGPGGGAFSGINVSRGSLGITVEISMASGIKEFAITPANGSPYSGGLPSCPTKYKAETNFSPDAYPLAVSVIDCEGNTNTFDVSSEGRYGGPSGASSGSLPGGMPPGGMPRGGFSGPGGCQSPEECMAYCQENPEKCEGFGPPSGSENGRRGGGFGPPPGFEGQMPPEGMPPGMRPPEGMMPSGGTMPPPGGMPGDFQQGFKGFEGMAPPGGMMPPEGSGFSPPASGVMPSPEQIQQIQSEQMQQQIQRQTEEQIRQQMQQQYQQFAPSNGSFTPPSSYTPPPGGSYSPPPDSSSPPPSYTPPPDGSYGPLPAGSSPPPSTAAPSSSLLGSFLQLLLNLFQ